MWIMGYEPKIGNPFLPDAPNGKYDWDCVSLYPLSLWLFAERETLYSTFDKVKFWLNWIDVLNFNSWLNVFEDDIIIPSEPANKLPSIVLSLITNLNL